MKRNIKHIVMAALLVAVAAAAVAQTSPAVVLQKGCALWNLEGEGMMKYAGKDLDPGTEVTVELSGATDSRGLPVARVTRATWTTAKNGQQLNFASVQYDGKPYYIISNRMAIGRTAAIVTQDAAFYNSAVLADVYTAAYIPFGTVVAVGSTQPVSGSPVRLQEATWFDEANYVLRTGYIRDAKVSTTKDDFTAYKILQNIESTTDDNKVRELFSNIDSLRITPVMRTQVDQARLLQAGDLSLLGTRDIDSPYTWIVSTDDGTNLNVRETASSRGAQVGQVADGTPVTPTLSTTEQQTIGGRTAPWYYILGTDPDGSPVQGWVFGAYLSMEPMEE